MLVNVVNLNFETIAIVVVIVFGDDGVVGYCDIACVHFHQVGGDVFGVVVMIDLQKHSFFLHRCCLLFVCLVTKMIHSFFVVVGLFFSAPTTSNYPFQMLLIL
jgi:hypothetical protein